MYGKIIIKNDYEQEGDLVLRSYIRALKKINALMLLDGDTAIIYGSIDDDNKFHELLTDKVIEYDKVLRITEDDEKRLSELSYFDIEKVKMIIEKVIFNKDIKLDFEISNMEELAMDRFIEFEAYSNGLSAINPYSRLEEDIVDYNIYNNFSYKCKKLKRK